MGWDFQHLRDIIDQVKNKDRIGFVAVVVVVVVAVVVVVVIVAYTCTYSLFLCG